MEKFFEGVLFKWTDEKNEKDIKITLRLSEDLLKKIDGFIEKLELRSFPIQGKGYKSLAVRMLLEDSLNRYMGPKVDPDQLVSPYADKMSSIIPILRNKRLREKLENMPEDISHNTEEINKIIKEYG